MTESAQPQHIAVVMDGNGRWAKKRKLPRIAGHKAGVNATRKMVETCARKSISVLTLFAFSSENWQRPEEEVTSLMALFVATIKAEVKKLNTKNVCVCFIGERSRFAKKLQNDINYAEQLTRDNTGLKLNIAVNYGGKWDIVNACKQIAEQVKNNQFSTAEINEDKVSQFLSLAHLPAPDLFIRTGDEQRISNFLLWQLAYSELYFSDKLWPDFSAEDLSLALNWFSKRQRRFGQTASQ